MNTAVDDVLLLLMFAGACWYLWLRFRHAHKRLDVIRYHAHADVKQWAKASLLGRKEVRVCPDCGSMEHDYRTLTRHAEHHEWVESLAERIKAIEQLLAEERGGGPVEEVKAVPWDGVSGELVEHAGAVDVTVGEIEARADEPEPEQVLAFRERFKDLIRP